MTTFEKEKKQFMANTLSIFMLTISFFVISLNFEGGGITLIIRKMIIASILIIMFMNALSDIQFKYTILIGILFAACMVCIDSIMLTLSEVAINQNIVSQDNVLSKFAWSLITKTILFIAAVSLRRYWKKSNLVHLRKMEWIIFLSFPVATIFSTTWILLSIENDYSYLMVTILTFLLMNIAVFYFMENIVKREEKSQQEKLTREQVRNQLRLYEQMNANYERQRREAHEYKNNISCIQWMLRSGDKKKAMDYVEKLLGKKAKDEVSEIETKNPILNAILNQKYHLAWEKNIIVTLSVNDLSQVEIEENDLVVLISNLFDNAIEAVEKMAQNKIIHFKMINEQEQLTVSIKNPIIEEVEVVEGNYIKTTKQDKENHGIGMKNIKFIIEKYQGASTIKCKDKWFNFSAILPHKQEKLKI